MARDIDELIEHVDSLTWMPPLIKEIVKARLEYPPTDEELEWARAHQTRD